LEKTTAPTAIAFDRANQPAQAGQRNAVVAGFLGTSISES
jgi:hypothetical protein